jgi:hypothetical protein
MNMKRSLAGAFLMLSLTSICPAQMDQGTSPRIYIEPQDGFESYIAAAIHKKHAPVVVTQNRDAANFVLTSGVKTKEESGASKVARCLFAYCAGIAGTQTASAQLIGAQSGEVLWAYNVRKPSSDAYQSTAEAIAKHLKEFLEKSPR